MGTFHVNLSGANIPVLSEHRYDAETIGYIKANDVYVVTDAFGGNGAAGTSDYEVTFFPGDGTALSGWMSGHLAGSMTALKDCALYKTHIYPELLGVEHAIFTAKESLSFYNSDGVKTGVLPTGFYIASASCISGSSNKELMYIDHAGLEEPIPKEGFIDLKLKTSAAVTSLPINLNF